MGGVFWDGGSHGGGHWDGGSHGGGLRASGVAALRAGFGRRLRGPGDLGWSGPCGVRPGRRGRGAERSSARGARPCGPHSDSELNGPQGRGVLRIVTDTCVRLWRRVHMDLIRYAGCVCRPSC
ncbi:putative leader peptide [Streptomyces sp. NPDC059785]|uniref:putative leader peptide n=1 Tax=Streptomyces sp. NPDC059785 TaxID=3346945 RepID=UPI0036558B8E